MKARTLSFCLALVLAVAVAAPAFAIPNHYGTGIYLYVVTCPNSYGGWNARYVSRCPSPLGPGCTCTRTTHDFPVDHPYERCAVGFDPDDKGQVTVLLDSAAVIQCGDTVEPPEEGETCGDPFDVVPVEAWEVDAEIRDLVESLVPEIEEQSWTPVEAIHYFFTEPYSGQ